MKPELAIYLSGSIQKGQADERDSFWTESEIRCIEGALGDFEVLLLNPAHRGDDLSDVLATLGRDLLQVAVADVVIVDARARRGLGVGAEMVVAQDLGIPVVTICPPDSHYYKLNFEFFGQHLAEWVHPFVHGLSDERVDDVRSACRWIRANVDTGAGCDVSGASERVRHAVAHYMRTQLHRDAPMRDMVARSASLPGRVEVWRAD